MITKLDNLTMVKEELEELAHVTGHAMQEVAKSKERLSLFHALLTRTEHQNDSRLEAAAAAFLTCYWWMYSYLDPQVEDVRADYQVIAEQLGKWFEAYCPGSTEVPHGE